MDLRGQDYFGSRPGGAGLANTASRDSQMVDADEETALLLKGPPSSPDPDDSHDDDDEDDDKPCDEEVGNGVGGGSGHSLSSKCVAMYARGDLRDHARRSAKSAGSMKYQPIQSVTSFFAKMLSRPTRVLEMAMGLGKEKGLDIVGQEAGNEIKQSSNQLAAGLLRRRHVSGDYSWEYGGARWTQ